MKTLPDVDDEAAERSDVAAFELLTRALIGIALEGLEVAGGQVSLPQFRLLLTLDGLGRVPSSKLAAQLRLAASAITRMVDRLQDGDLVQRGTDPRSRCIVTVEPTAAGRRLVDAVLARRHERLGAVLDRMTPADHTAAVRAARQFASLSGDAIARRRVRTGAAVTPRGAPGTRPASATSPLRPRMLLITAWALPVGGFGALAALALLRLIGLITNLVFYQRCEHAPGRPGRGHHHRGGSSCWRRSPAGWWSALMARFGSEKIRGHGMPEAIEAILTQGSRVDPKVAVLKPVSAAISIGTGGPFGAEGPIIMTGGAIGSMIAQHAAPDRRRAQDPAGRRRRRRHGGDLQLPARRGAARRRAAAVRVAAAQLRAGRRRVAVAHVVRGLLLGTRPDLPRDAGDLHLTAGDELLCVVAGLSAALLAIAATGLVYASEDAFSRLPLHWMWWPAIGGLVIGIGGLIEPRALGVGYDVIDQLLTGRATLSLDRRHPRRQDADLVAVAGLRHLRRCAGPGVHDRRRARRRLRHTSSRTCSPASGRCSDWPPSSAA